MKLPRVPIVEEIRRIRREHAAKFDFDIERIMRDAQQRERLLPKTASFHSRRAN